MKRDILNRSGIVAGVMILLLIQGCGGGGSTDDATTEPLTLSMRSLSGNVALGPVSGATVTVTRLGGSELFSATTTLYDEAIDTTEYNTTARKLKPFEEQSVGRFAYEAERSWWPSDSEIVRVTASGGIDIDPNDDGLVLSGEGVAFSGSLTTFVRFGDLRTGDVTLNLLSAAAAAVLDRRHVRDVVTIKKVLDGAATAVFSSDPLDVASPDHRSFYRFNPALLDENGTMRHLAALYDGNRYETMRVGDFAQGLYEDDAALRLADSDGDGAIDAFEILVGSDPLEVDSDSDGVNDYAEAWAGTDAVDGIDASSDPLYLYQWHLENTGQSSGALHGGTAGEDMNVHALDARYAGSGEVVVALLDEGVEYDHPDLRASLDISLSYNYATGNENPTPSGPHGTACAGIIAAQGWNGTGVRGVAPMTRLAGLNIFESYSDSRTSDALQRTGMDVSSNSWGPVIDTDHCLGAGGLFEWSLLTDAIETGVSEGRDGKGTVYVFAGGNERVCGANANFSSLHNFKQVITVGAVAADGTVSSYSTRGTNLLVSGPGGEYGVTDPAVVTTDLMGPSAGYDTTVNHFDVVGNENSDYTHRMNGTSAATPAVAGVVALMLQANPELTWRDVKYVLAHTARQNDPGSSEWSTNGAGLPVSHDFGFGMVDAAAAVAMAEGFAGLPSEQVTAIYTDAPAAAIPDNDATGVTATIDVTENITIEHVDLWFSSDHDYIDDLEIILVSPSGTQSTLAWGGEGFLNWTENYNQWRFSTTHCMDESSAGTWTLIVKDLAEDDIGQITNWKLQISGH